MKNICLFLPIFIILANSMFCKAEEAPDPVRDTYGRLLRTKHAYYILHVGPWSGGGLELINTNYTTCPVDVVQSGADTPGSPVAFFPVNLKKGVIRVLTDLNIMFPNTSMICPESPVCKIDHYYTNDPLNRDYFITTGGLVGNPKPGTLGNWFKIQKFGDGYKLLHCPDVYTFCNFVCKDVGFYVQNGQRRLALTTIPLWLCLREHKGVRLS